MNKANKIYIDKSKRSIVTGVNFCDLNIVFKEWLDYIRWNRL